MRGFAAFAIAIIWAGLAQAAPVRVQTGEHADFTRVVLTIPAGADWQLGRSETGYVLRLAVTEGFATGDFFDLIPQDRITAVSQNAEDGELRIDLGCACYAEAFLDSPRVLVIDIRDGVAGPGAAFEAPLHVAEAALAQEKMPFAGSPYQLGQNRVLSLFPSEIAAPVAATIDAGLADTAIVRAAPQPQSLVGGGAATDLAALEQSVTESLGRALSQGLLDIDRGGADAAQTTPDLQNTPAPGLNVSTSIDRAAIPDDPIVPVTQKGDACIPGHFFDVGSWGDDRPYGAQIGEARSQLTSEFDRFESDAVVTLARRLIYFGFGREARQVLRLDGVQSQERRYLAAIARIIDEDPVDTALFEQQVSCASEVALWAALAFPDGALDATLDRPSVLRAFKALPPDLQNHLAPRLTKRFVAIGDSDAAMQALGTIQNVYPLPLEAELANIALNRALGDDIEVTAQLQDIVETDARVTPQVMIASLTDATRNNRRVRPEDHILADALRFENAQLPIAADLAVAQIYAYLQADEFSQARRLMQEEASNIGVDRSAALMNAFTTAATANMADGDFLALAFENDRIVVAPEVENGVARRLLALGFAARAEEFLSGDANAEAGEERRYLLAEAAIARGELDKVATILAGSNTARAQSLRQIVGEIRAANSILASDFRSPSDLRDVMALDDPVLQAATTTMPGPQVTTVDPAMPLTSSRTLLEQSVQSRGVVEDLLARFTAPADF